MAHDISQGTALQGCSGVLEFRISAYTVNFSVMGKATACLGKMRTKHFAQHVRDLNFIPLHKTWRAREWMLLYLLS